MAHTPTHAIPADTLDETVDIQMPETKQPQDPATFLKSLEVGGRVLDPNTDQQFLRTETGFQPIADIPALRDLEAQGRITDEGAMGTATREQIEGVGDIGDPITARTEAERGFDDQKDERSSLMDDLKDLFRRRRTEMPARQAEVEEELNITGQQKQLQELNLMMQQASGQFEREFGMAELTGRLQPFVTGQQAAIRRQQAAEIGAMASVAEALQGNITLSQQIADRTVELEFGELEQEIEDTMDFLELNEPEFTAAEKKLADERKAELEAEKARIKEEKEERKSILQIAQDAAKNGATNENIMAILQTENQESAIAMASPFLQDITYSTQTVDGRKVRFGFDASGDIVSRVDLGASGGGTSNERFDSASSEAITRAREELDKFRGEDGFVDPSAYMKLRTDFAEMFGATRVDEFDDVFSSELSPQERARLGIGKATGVKAAEQADPEDVAMCNYIGGTMVNGVCQF